MNKALVEEALLMAMAYIRYVQGFNPTLHGEANGTPPIDTIVQRAIIEVQPDYMKGKPQ